MVLIFTHRCGRAQAARSDQPLRAIPNLAQTRVSLDNTSISDVSSVDEADQAGPSTTPSSPEVEQENPTADSSPKAEDSAEDSPPKASPPSGLAENHCGICDDVVLYDPLLRWGPWSTTPLERKEGAGGMVMHCGYGHVYCFSCLSTYLGMKLKGADEKAVFPISCPGPSCDWRITEIEAKLILDKSEMETMWYWAKLFDEVPLFYCPLGTCGARIALPGLECKKEVRQAECPACKETFCFKCQVKWHEGQSCAKYSRASGALARDKALQKLAKQFKWRRCPRCRIVVERNYGCRHMSCRCGHQFCYNCGRGWGDGCGSFRSKFCFPTKVEIWPETRSWVTEFVRDIFGMNRALAAERLTPNRQV